MDQIPPLDPSKVLEYLDNLNIDEKIDEYFKNNDINNSNLIDADYYKNIFNELNNKIGIQKSLGKKEWDWVLNLINKKSGDKLNKEEAKKIYNQMIIIARDYLHSLPNSKNNNISLSTKLNQVKKEEKKYFELIKEIKFEGDIIKGKSINNIIDLNNNHFMATIGERGKALINKENYEIISYKKDFGMYVTSKVNSFLICAINSEDITSLWYTDFNLDFLEKIEYEESDMHKNWITKIVQISENKIIN